MSFDNNEYSKALKLVKQIWATTKCLKCMQNGTLDSSKGQSV